MAWIKMTCGLCDEPEVIGIAAELDIEEDLVVGKLHRFWSWADQKTESGNAASVTVNWIDRYLSVTGFADAMVKVGWLEVNIDGIVLPDFGKHMGQSAKKRANTAIRVAKHKAKVGNAKVTPPALPREEKRREEKNKEERKKNKERGLFDTKPSVAKPTSLEEVLAHWQQAGLSGDPGEFWAFYESNGWKVGKNPMKKWRAAASGWSSRQKNGKVPGSNGKPNALEEGDEAIRQWLNSKRGSDGNNGNRSESSGLIVEGVAKDARRAIG